MKKILLICAVAIIAIILFLFYSFGGQKYNPEETLNLLKSIDSYTCNMTIEMKNEKQTIVYNGNQAFDKNFGYRIQIGNERTLIFNKNKILINDKQNKHRYTENKEFDSVYTLSLIGEYIELLYTNEQIKYLYKEIKGVKYLGVKLLIPGNNRNLNEAELYIDIKNDIPCFIIIKDSRDKETIRITYKNFIPNVRTKENLFKDGGE